MTTDLASPHADVERIQRIEAVPRILAAVARLTGMRFAAVARVTDTAWTCCAALDEMEFGLAPGGELGLETTLCNEVRQHSRPIVFGHASRNADFAHHHTVRRYGLESYIAVPILRRDGSFFGTLCAIDSRPADIEASHVVQTLQLMAELIGLQLELGDELASTRQHLRHANLRAALASAGESQIRDLLQPAITTTYMLRTSPTLEDQDRSLASEVEASLLAVVSALRDHLDAAMDSVDLREPGPSGPDTSARGTR